MPSLSFLTLHSIFNPASPEARELNALTIWVIALCCAILILVVSLIVTICIKFRSRPNSPEPKPVHGNIKLEILWTGIPLLILTVVMLFTIRTMIATSPPENAGNPDLIVTGHQWWWEIHYPFANGNETITANEVHIPVGKRILLELRSADVIHDFWVPELGRKIDAIPGHPNQIWLQADHEGRYPGFCAEFCGSSHAWMKILVIAQNQSDYDLWLKHESTPSTLAESTQNKNGLNLFREKTCTSCHRVEGISENIQIGPDLSHFASREMLAAGALKNTPGNLLKWLKNPNQVKPGTHMPAFGFSDTELRDLTSFLESLP